MYAACTACLMFLIVFIYCIVQELYFFLFVLILFLFTCKKKIRRGEPGTRNRLIPKYAISLHSQDLARFSLLLDSASDACIRALALSSSIPHAGYWLNVVPSTALGLHLLDREFWLCLHYWLGLQMFAVGAQCLVCHSAADLHGHRLWW